MDKLNFLRAALLALTVFFSAHVLAQAGRILEDDYLIAGLSLEPAPPGISGAAPSPQPMRPARLLKLSPEHRFVIWVELTSGRLHVLEQTEEGVFYPYATRAISIGKQGYGKELEGDQKTPVGIYRVVDWLADEELAERYGNGAWPINYPNEVDRLHQRTGYGIWLHGIDRSLTTRPLLDSDGCIVLDNNSIDWLADYVDVGSTKVILATSMSWQPAAEVDQRAAELEQVVEDWRRAWSSLDNDNYLSFYSEQFDNFDKNFTEWDAYKRRIHAHKSFVDVSINNLSLIQYPGDDTLVLAEFDQSYRSSNFNADGKKRLLWRQQADGQWKIIYEGAGF